MDFRFRLILAYLLTVPVLAAGYYFNGLSENDTRAPSVMLFGGFLAACSVGLLDRR